MLSVVYGSNYANPMATRVAIGAFMAASVEARSKLAHQLTTTESDYQPVQAVLFLATAIGFWTDVKIGRGLRSIKVPFPRVVLAAGADIVLCQTSGEVSVRVRNALT